MSSESSGISAPPGARKNAQLPCQCNHLYERLARLSRRMHEIQEAERRHFARELHDEIGQLLTSLKLLFRAGAIPSAGEVVSRFERARLIVDDLLEKTRGLSFDLRSAVLDQFGLLPALLEHFERFTHRTGILVDFNHQEIDRRFSPAIETTIYRVVQESLTNVARHAGVSGVAVRAWTDGSQLCVQIQDWGKGFDADNAADSTGANGLPGMKERIGIMGGEMLIESSRGEGTIITAELPLENARET